jgi:hypothetical protein
MDGNNPCNAISWMAFHPAIYRLLVIGDVLLMVDSNLQSAAKDTGSNAAVTSHWSFHSGKLFDEMKEKAKSAGHSALGVMKKGEEAAAQAAHSPQAQHAVESANKAVHSPEARQAAATAAHIAKDATKPETAEVQGAIAAGKRGDVNGVVRNALPLAEEAALGPHVLLINKAREELAKRAGVTDTKRETDAAHAHSKMQKILPAIELIGHDKDSAKK